MDGDDLAGRGTDAERVASVSAGLLVAAVGSISPSAAAILLVNDDIAQPAQDLSVEVPILALEASGLLGSAGSTESTMVVANLRTRWM